MPRIASFVLCLALVSGASAQQKKRVAVMNFDYATVQSGVAALFGSNQDIGKGIADILVDKLVNDGVYSVIERKQLDKILAEQNFSNSDRADPNSAAKIARILGVDAIIVGSITQFGRDDKSTDVGGGAASGALGPLRTRRRQDFQVHRRLHRHRAHDRYLHRRDPRQRPGTRRRVALRHRHPRRGRKLQRLAAAARST